MKYQIPRYLPVTLADGLRAGEKVTIAGMKGVFIIGEPPKQKHDYGIRSKNYPKPK